MYFSSFFDWLDFPKWGNMFNLICVFLILLSKNYSLQCVTINTRNKEIIKYKSVSRYYTSNFVTKSNIFQLIKNHLFKNPCWQISQHIFRSIVPLIAVTTPTNKQAKTVPHCQPFCEEIQSKQSREAKTKTTSSNTEGSQSTTKTGPPPPLSVVVVFACKIITLEGRERRSL